MSAEFDPYYKWLGIPQSEQPPNHYRLLGLGLFEPSADVIETAADRQMRHVQTFKTGQYSADSQKLLNELSQARLCLLRPELKAAYDRQLQAALGPKALPAAAATAQPIRKAVALEDPAVIPEFSTPIDAGAAPTIGRASRRRAALAAPPGWSNRRVLGCCGRVSGVASAAGDTRAGAAGRSGDRRRPAARAGPPSDESQGSRASDRILPGRGRPSGIAQWSAAPGSSPGRPARSRARGNTRLRFGRPSPARRACFISKRCGSR